jgi:hypothetical protein
VWCLAAAPAGAATSSTFHAKFSNEAGTLVRAVVLHSDGTEQKKAKINPKNAKGFDFEVQCNNSHSRGFKVYELAGDAYDVIGSGTFTMTTGKKAGSFLDSHCKSPTLTIDACDDVEGDDFSVTCSVGQRHDFDDLLLIKITD